MNTNTVPPNLWHPRSIRARWIAAVSPRHLADDNAWTGANGKVWSKAQTLASLKSGEDIVSSCVTDDFKVRV